MPARSSARRCFVATATCCPLASVGGAPHHPRLESPGGGLSQISPEIFAGEPVSLTPASSLGKAVDVARYTQPDIKKHRFGGAGNRRGRARCLLHRTRTGTGVRDERAGPETRRPRLQQEAS